MASVTSKIIFAAALGFVSGAALAAFVTYKLMYESVEEKGMAYFEEELAKARVKISENNAKQKEVTHNETKTEQKVEAPDANDISEGDYPADDDEEADNDAHVNDYRRYFQSYGGGKRGDRAKIMTRDEAVNSRNAKPMLVDDYESLIAIVPKGESQIYEWTFYCNFRGGVVVDIQTEMVMNYERIFNMTSKELMSEFKDTDTIYIYLPGDNMGVILGLDPETGPELLELDIPEHMYPSPSEDDEDDDDDEDDVEWGD